MQKALPLILLLMVLLAATTPLRSTAGAVSADNAQAYELTAAYPNPFNNSTTFSLTVNERQHVLVEVYNMLGHRLAVLRSEEHTSELQSRGHLVCRLLLEKKKQST